MSRRQSSSSARVSEASIDETKSHVQSRLEHAHFCSDWFRERIRVSLTLCTRIGQSSILEVGFNIAFGALGWCGKSCVLFVLR